MSLALSTAWNSLHYNQAKGLISQIKGLGFDAVELNFNLTSLMVKEISSLVKKGEIEIVSLHNFCPIPQGIERNKALPDYYSLGSLDKEERKKAIKYTKRTIDTAGDLNAKAVVLHSGRVEVADLTLELIRLYNHAKKATREYKELLNRMLKERKEKVKTYFENTLKSLEVLNRYAQSKDILLGLENRFYYREIPSFEEIRTILNAFKGANIFYWHDTGHAQVLENLGFTRHKEYLKLYSDYMVGIHLHDVSGTSDHQAPNQGEIDFKIFKHYIKKDTLKVIEAHHSATEKEIIESKKYLESIFNGKL